MVNYFEDDFCVQGKFKDGVKMRGKGGSKKNIANRKKANNSKQMYNSKHIRIQAEKIQNCKLNKSNIKEINQS